MGAILTVTELTVTVKLANGETARVVDSVSFKVPRGGTLGLVGESGSGKTMTSLAIVGLLPRNATVCDGEVLLAGENLLRLPKRAMRRLRGSRISMILQDPLTALDPCFTLGSQLAEPLYQHRRLRGSELTSAMVSALEQVQLSGAKERLHQFPHQLSGGMRQRATSAIALAGRPELLIADEPTTALDTFTQAHYLKLLRDLQQEHGFALVLVAHDLLVVRHMCSHVVVMYSGQVVEHGQVADVFEAPRHPYTRALVKAIPKLDQLQTLESIEGQAPDVGETITGCRFAERCPFAREICRTTVPSLTIRDGGTRTARCFGTAPDGWIEW